MRYSRHRLCHYTVFVASQEPQLFDRTDLKIILTKSVVGINKTRSLKNHVILGVETFLMT